MDGVISHSVISKEDTVLYFFLPSPTCPGHCFCTFSHLGRSPKAAAELILATPVEIHQYKEKAGKTTASPQLQNTGSPNQRGERHTHVHSVLQPMLGNSTKERKGLSTFNLSSSSTTLQ